MSLHVSRRKTVHTQEVRVQEKPNACLLSTDCVHASVIQPKSASKAKPKQKTGRPKGSATPVALLPTYKPAMVNVTASHGIHVVYAVLDVQTNEYKRYRIMLNKHAKYYSTRRKMMEFAKSVAMQVNIKLAGGWTPAGETQNSRFYTPMTDVIVKYLDDREKEVRKATYLSYKSTCRVFGQWLEKNLPGCRAIDFNRLHALEYMSYLFDERDVSNKTYNNYLKQMRLLMEWSIVHCYCKENPFKTIKARKREVKKRTVIQQDIRKDIQTYLEEHDETFLIFVELVFFALMRPMEIRRCKIGQVHLDAHYIHIPADQAKCWKERNAPLSDELVRRLRVYLEKNRYHSDDYLFSSFFRPGATMVGYRAVWKRWHKVVRAIGLKDGQTVYSLRDSGIVDMLHAGVDDLTVMQAAGHHDLSITSVYADHVDTALIERVREGQVDFGNG